MCVSTITTLFANTSSSKFSTCIITYMYFLVNYEVILIRQTKTHIIFTCTFCFYTCSSTIFQNIVNDLLKNIRNKTVYISLIKTIHTTVPCLLSAIPSDQILNSMSAQAHFYATKGKERAGPMLPETQALLVELYKPYVEELGKFLNDERFLFKSESFG